MAPMNAVPSPPPPHPRVIYVFIMRCKARFWYMPANLETSVARTLKSCDALKPPRSLFALTEEKLTALGRVTAAGIRCEIL